MRVALARAQGFSTAAIGKVGPMLRFDHTDRKRRGLMRGKSTAPFFLAACFFPATPLNAERC
jgi:hypothetical protein